jgi:hypothetical protein
MMISSIGYDAGAAATGLSIDPVMVLPEMPVWCNGKRIQGSDLVHWLRGFALGAYERAQLNRADDAAVAEECGLPALSTILITLLIAELIKE